MTVSGTSGKSPLSSIPERRSPVVCRWKGLRGGDGDGVGAAAALGYDVGDRVHSGAILETCATEDNPCRHAVLNFKHTAGWGWARGGRASYDPLTTLLAVREASRIGLSECVGCDGINRFDSATGKNHWVKGPRSNQSYVVLKDAAAAESALDELLCQPRLAGRVPKPPPPPRPPPAPPVIPNMGACTVIDVTSDSYGHLKDNPGVYFVCRLTVLKSPGAPRSDATHVLSC